MRIGSIGAEPLEAPRDLSRPHTARSQSSRKFKSPRSRPRSARKKSSFSSRYHHSPITLSSATLSAFNAKSEYVAEALADQVANHNRDDDAFDCIPENEGNAWCYLFYEFIVSQTSLPALILYMNLFWYLFIMSTFGIRNMTSELWLNSLVLASLMFITLNAANYESPACGPDGYFTRIPYKRLFQFWLLPFGAFSVFMACHSAEGECVVLFPTDITLLTIHIGMMAFIMASGLAIHYVFLPKLYVIQKGQSLYLVRAHDALQMDIGARKEEEEREDRRDHDRDRDDEREDVDEQKQNGHHRNASNLDLTLTHSTDPMRSSY